MSVLMLACDFMGSLCRAAAACKHAVPFLFLMLQTPALSADFLSKWDGADGNWSNAVHWSTAPLVPHNGIQGFTFDASILRGRVAVDGDFEANTLTIAKPGTGDPDVIADLRVEKKLTTQSATIGGSFVNGFFIEASGKAEVAVDGDTTVWENSDLILLASGGQGALNITNGGTVNTGRVVNGGAARSGIFVDYGRAAINVAGTGSVLHVNENLATGTSGSGKITISNGATLSVDGKIDMGSRAELEVSKATIDVAGEIITQVGSIVSGIGTVKGRLFVGTGLKIRAGSRLSVVGDLVSQLPRVKLEFQVDGGSLQNTNAILSVSKNATLGGTLAISASNQLGKSGSRMVKLLSADMINGKFLNVPKKHVHLGSGVFFRDIGYSDSTVAVELFQASAGDVDGDGTVQLADFLVLANRFNTLGAWTDGDFDLDGRVAFPDYLLLANNFGHANQSFDVVPEPSSVCVATVGLVLLLACSRLRHSST